MGGIFPIWEGSPPAARPGGSVGLSGTQRTRPLSGPACPPPRPLPGAVVLGVDPPQVPIHRAGRAARRGGQRPLAFRRREPQDGGHQRGMQARWGGPPPAVSENEPLLGHESTPPIGGVAAPIAYYLLVS